ncbi:MAG: polysaccharide biosynthesis/export family protein [Dehalococcoidales bacterium]|nr:polysaccharide biosynthesis/export family protein [Dehalococcoidales bacterium]
MSLSRFIVLFLLVLATVSCAKRTAISEDDEKPTVSASAKKVDSYKIGVDDGLSINVWRNPELSVNVPVRPDGKISVPLIGDVAAGGLTAEEVAASIKQKLSNYIRDPNVTVIVTGLRSHEFISRVRVTGAVRQPKSLVYRDGMTVLDAVLEAGGLNDFAAGNRTKLYRKTPSKIDVIEIKLDNILLKGKLDTNAELRPGDIVTVPERLF